MLKQIGNTILIISLERKANLWIKLLPQTTKAMIRPMISFPIQLISVSSNLVPLRT